MGCRVGANECHPLSAERDSTHCSKSSNYYEHSLPPALKNPASLSCTRITETGHAREGARPRWAPPLSRRPSRAWTSPSRQPTLSGVPASTISHARPLARIHPQIVIIHNSTSPLAVADGVVVVPPKGEPRADAAKPAFARVDVKVGQGKGEQLAHRVADGRGLAVGRAGGGVLKEKEGVRRLRPPRAVSQSRQRSAG